MQIARADNLAVGLLMLGRALFLDRDLLDREQRLPRLLERGEPHHYAIAQRL